MDDRRTGVRYPTSAREFDLFHSDQTGTGAYSDSHITVNTSSFFTGIKRRGREANKSPPSNYSPHTHFFVAWCLINSTHRQLLILHNWRIKFVIHVQATNVMYLHSGRTENKTDASWTSWGQNSRILDIFLTTCLAVNGSWTTFFYVWSL